jgi:PRTRC genetic system protein C
MAGIQVGVMPRVFSYKGQDLPDPNPAMSVKEVINHYSNQYHDLVNGFEKEQTLGDGKMIIELGTAIGVKG